MATGQEGNVSFKQIRATHRHGNGPQAQASDGTGANGHFPKFTADGTLTDSGIAAFGPLLLETNGTPNGSQTELNLVAGANITLIDDGLGDVTISATGTDELEETPAGTRNGTNTVFTLAHTPKTGAPIALYLNGVLQRPTFDYALSASTIYYAWPPKSDDWHLCYYVPAS